MLSKFHAEIYDLVRNSPNIPHNSLNELTTDSNAGFNSEYTAEAAPFINDLNPSNYDFVPFDILSPCNTKYVIAAVTAEMSPA